MTERLQLSVNKHIRYKPSLDPRISYSKFDGFVNHKYSWFQGKRLKRDHIFKFSNETGFGESSLLHNSTPVYLSIYPTNPTHEDRMCP